MSAASMSIMVLQGRRSFLFQLPEKLEKMKMKKGKAMKRESRWLFGIEKHCFRVECDRKRGRCRVVKTVTCLAFMLAFLLKRCSWLVSLLPREDRKQEGNSWE